MSKNTYESPLNSRYASAEMQYIFSPDRKFTTWRWRRARWTWACP